MIYIEYRPINNRVDYHGATQIGYGFYYDGRPLLRFSVTIADDDEAHELIIKMTTLKNSYESALEAIHHPAVQSANSYEEKMREVENIFTHRS